MTMRNFGILCIALALSGLARGNGLLVPKDGSLPPLAIKHQRVNIDVKDGVANTRMEQVFHNHTNRDLEAVYVFPVPDGAAIGDFAMYINGKRMSGELVEKGKARKIYQDIVRRMKDPGLLEHLGDNLFKVSIYPVPKKGDQRIELEYTQTLPYEGGLYALTYPLKTGKQASQTLEDFTVSVRISSRVPIKNIYSPSHKVGISRKGDNEAVIGFEEDRSLLDKDFLLYYGVSKKDFGLNMLTSADGKKDGYFMMMLSPTVKLDKDMVIEKDVTFVFDTSGSMAVKKMEQAREALMYCIARLNEKDRFNVVRFSTDVEVFKPELVEASKANRSDAVAFVSEFVARGGTDINGAVRVAMKMKHDAERPYIIVFLTDGKPTVGTTQTEEILKDLEKAGDGQTRAFVFGVGEKVNTLLLDRISSDHGGLSQYVRPEENIEVKVSSFVDKISHPVLANLTLDVKDVELRKMHPKKLPDLFGGQQLTLFGRYKGDGHVAITLKGDVNGEKKKFVYEADFPEQVAGNEFIRRLWGTRRVGYLLDEIRLHGEDRELKDEVIALSKDYGIMTPYTSYLVLESEEAYGQHGIARAKRGFDVKMKNSASVARRPRSDQKDGLSAFNRPAVPMPMEEAEISFEALREVQVAGDSADAVGKRDANMSLSRRGASPRKSMAPVFGEAAPAASTTVVSASKPRPVLQKMNEEKVQQSFKKESGSEAIQLSQAIDAYKYSERDEGTSSVYKRVKGRIFYQINGIWTDSTYKKGMKTKKVTFASDAYFDLLTEKPELKSFFSLGERVIVVLEDGSAVEVTAAL